MLWNAFLLALRAIRRNLLRSFLTILGIVIGIAAVITLVSVGNGATRAVSEQIASMGMNMLVLSPGQRLGPGGGGAPPFKRGDVDAIRQQVTAIDGISPIAIKSVTAVYQARNWATMVAGVTNDYFRVANWPLVSGRMFLPLEERIGKPVCVLGDAVRERLFGAEAPLGREIRMKRISCEVVGLLKTRGQAAMGNQDDTVIMPLRAVQRLLVGTQDIARMVLSVREGSSIEAAKQQLGALMRERRKLGDKDADDFHVMDTRQIAETFTGTMRIMTMLLGAVAGVSLLVGGIGIMNIMLVSVTERTREIGIRLAIGALGHEVLLQFLIEAVVLSGIGGLVGIGLATGASIGLTGLMGVPYAFAPGIHLLALVFSAAIGVVFGYFPARRAARLNPIDALRHE